MARILARRWLVRIIAYDPVAVSDVNVVLWCSEFGALAHFNLFVIPPVSRLRWNGLVVAAAADKVVTGGWHRGVIRPASAAALCPVHAANLWRAWMKSARCTAAVFNRYRFLLPVARRILNMVKGGVKSINALQASQVRYGVMDG